MEISLDIRTLFAALTVVLTCLAAAFSFVFFTQKTYPGFKRWTLATVATALGYLFIVLRGPIPAAVSIMVGNNLLIVGAALVFAGTRRFLGLKPWPRFQVAVPLACLAGLAWFLWVDEFLGMRAMVVSLAAAILLFPVAWMFISHAPRGHRPLYLGTGIMFALFNFATLLRGASMVASGYHFQLFANSPMQAFFYVFLIMFQASWFIGLLLMNSQRMSDELRRSRAELTVTVDNMERILDFLPDPTWVVDAKGRITHWNQAMEALTGVPASQVLGKGNYEHALPLYGERRPCLIDLMLEHNPEWEGRYQNLERRGDLLVTSESFLPKLGEAGLYIAGSATCLRDEQGRVSGAIETLRDVSEAKRGQQEREKLIDELTAALAKVQTLKGLIPICSHCKSIRSDQGYWEQLETFFSDHAEVEFSHGICPDCLEKYYKEFKHTTSERDHPDGELGKRDHPDDVG
ncbi:MAG: PAS domain-containing protein [Proteobacteria bacterium]|nr:PAS domain-containing protein [Pseudomonadota bacterium]MCG2766445.1 PAS domain-containing protein [Desulfarculaceae bacterium]